MQKILVQSPDCNHILSGQFQEKSVASDDFVFKHEINSESVST